MGSPWVQSSALQVGPVWHRSHQEGWELVAFYVAWQFQSAQDFFCGPYQSPHPIPPQGLRRGSSCWCSHVLNPCSTKDTLKAQGPPPPYFQSCFFHKKNSPEQSKHEDLGWPRSGTPNLRCILPSRKSLAPQHSQLMVMLSVDKDEYSTRKA